MLFGEMGRPTQSSVCSRPASTYAGSLHSVRPFSVQLLTRHQRPSRLCRGGIGHSLSSGVEELMQPDETLPIVNARSFAISTSYATCRTAWRSLWSCQLSNGVDVPVHTRPDRSEVERFPTLVSESAGSLVFSINTCIQSSLVMGLGAGRVLPYALVPFQLPLRSCADGEFVLRFSRMLRSIRSMLVDPVKVIATRISASTSSSK